VTNDAEIARRITIAAPPPLHPRLWFPERELVDMLIWGQYTVFGAFGAFLDPSQWPSSMGRWTMNTQDRSSHHDETILSGLRLRYEDWDTNRVSVWQMTDTRMGPVGGGIEWRLGLWPD
jgi:hypothetical protein